jgi:anti-sigma B factor antagonist
VTDIATRTLNDGIAVVRPPARLNMTVAPQLAATVDEIIAGGHARVVIDLTNTEFIDSSGLGALVSCLKKTRQAGGDLRIAGPTQHVQTILDLTNLGRVLQPSATVEIALTAFSS